MSAIVKMEKTFNCLTNFVDNCNNEEYKKLIDIFLPMFYQENKHRLEISVGKRVSESEFCSLLSMVTTDFMIGFNCWNNEPQMVIKDVLHHSAVTIINLELIKDLHIESQEDDSINFYEYNIYFNYNDKIDYHVHIVINE